MEQVTTYTIKAKHRPDVWLFKYHLNGVLKSFEVLDGILDERQIAWLFTKGNFPYTEAQAKQFGTGAELKKYFEVTIGLPILTFEAFWEAYEKKQKKIKTQQLWKKLNEADRLKAIEGIRRYNNHLRLHPGISKCYPDVYINQRRWEDYS